MKSTLLALLLSAFAATSSPAQVVDPHAMRDSLAASADTAALRRIAASDASAAPLDHLRRGFAALRLYELTGARAAAATARTAFERARDLAPHDPFAELGLGLALLALADADDADASGIVAGQAFARAFGFDARSRARRALERSLAAEPALAEAADALARVALATHDAEALRAAHAALVRVTGGSDASPRSWVGRARVALALDDPAEALAASETALALGGPLHPEALRTRAIALLRSAGRAAEGERAYFDAVRAASAATAAAFRDDISELAGTADLERFDALTAAERLAFLEAFWDVRAGLAGVTVAERLAEHYRRLALAFARYRRQANWGAVPVNALLRDRPDGRFDDRGLMLLRHGEPLESIRTLDRDLGRNESWLYTDAGGEPYMAHFLEYDGFSDYVLIYNVPCAPAWIADRLAYDARMNVLRHRCSSFDQRSVSYEIRRAVYAALATDSYRPAFAADLPFVFDLHTFRGANGGTDVLVSAAAADTLRALTFSVTLVDTVSGTVTRARSRTAAAEGDDDDFTAHLVLETSPAQAAAVRVVARAAAAPTTGRLLGRGIAVPDYRGDTLMVSDVVLARPVAAAQPTTWERAGHPIALAPAGTFGRDGFRVFAEIYNLPAGERFSLELRVERDGGGVGRALRRLFGRHTSVRLRFDDIAAPDADGAVRVLRNVQSDLDPGNYALTVRITVGDRSVERRRRFRVER